MSNNFALRIHTDCLGDNGMDILRGLLRDIGTSGYIFSLESDATRQHVQGWIRTSHNQQAIRARIKRLFPGVVGNKGYSLRNVKNMEAYADYVLKGTTEEVAVVVASHSIELTDDYLQTVHRRYWSKHVGTSKGSIVKQVYEWAGSIEDVSKRDIIDRVCTVITHMNKPLMVPYVVGVVNSVRFKLGGSQKNVMIDYIDSLIPD